MDKPSDEVLRIADQVAAQAFGRSGESLTTYGLDGDGYLGHTSCVICGEDGQYWRRLLRCVAITAINRARALPVRTATPEAAAAAEKVKACRCTSDGRHLCALYGQQSGAGQKIEPDADGQIRPCGARLSFDPAEGKDRNAIAFGCAICGKSYPNSADARECCTEQEGGRR